MLRDALRAAEQIGAPAFIIWNSARRCYFNAAARTAFPMALGESGCAFVRATPFVQEMVRLVEGIRDPNLATRMAFGNLDFVTAPLFNLEGGIEGTIVRAGGFEQIPALYRELQADTSLLSQIVHLLPVLVFTVRPNGEHDFVNRAFNEYAGLALLRGGRIAFESIVHKEDRGALPAPWGHAKEPPRDLYAAEVRLLRLDGTYRWHTLRLSAIRSRGGAIVKWIGTLLDIDDRLAAEAALAQVNVHLDARIDELERVLDVAPVGIAIANGFESDEVRLNRALMELLGETEAFVPYGHRAFRYLRGVDLEQIAPDADGVEIEVERSDGTLRQMAVSVVPLKGLDGNGGVVASYVDISARRAEMMRREMLLVAHRGLSLATNLFEIVEAVVTAVAPYADGCAIATPEGVVLDDPLLAPPVRAALERGTTTAGADGRSVVCAFTIEGRAVATLALRRAEPRPAFDRRDVDALSELAQIAGVSIDRTAMLARERTNAYRLNRLLLPARLPHHAGLDLSVAYRTADRSVPIGGDWYDAFALPDGLIGLSIGDVAGHGIEAAIAMYALRQTMRDAALQGAGPGEVLARANDLLFEDSADGFATACFAIVDPQRGSVRYALAGHPPPIAARRGSDAGVERHGGLPLGIRREYPQAQSELRIDDVALFALYTDGVIGDVRDEVAVEGRLLRALASTAELEDGSAATAILTSLFVGRQALDDAALIVVRFVERRRSIPTGDFDGAMLADVSLTD